VISASANKAEVSRSLDEIIARVVNEAGEGDAVGYGAGGPGNHTLRNAELACFLL